jgi:large subunit ribosomal protein L15
MPYKRGFFNRFRVEYEVINLGMIAKLEIDGDISPESLYARGAIGSTSRPLKILGNGDLRAPVRIRAHKFSAAAREKIEAAGGSAEVIG